MIADSMMFNFEEEIDIEEDIVKMLECNPESGFEESKESIECRPIVLEELRNCYNTFGSEVMEPFLEIIEQPQSYYRFRYLTEFKDNPHGPLTGEKSSKLNKTFPKVALRNYSKKAIIRCWLCINKGKDVHIHQLLTKNDGRGIRNEPHDVIVDTTNNFTAQFEGLNIIHAVTKGKKYLECFHEKKCYIKSGFNLNKSLYPYNEAALRKEVKDMEKNKAVLYFQAFDHDTRVELGCEIFSHEIKNSKNPNTSTLKIARQSVTGGEVSGGTEVIIFVEKVSKDVKIMFFEKNGPWKEAAEIVEVWHQVAIAFRTPAYKDLSIDQDKEVYFQLVRESDSSYSNEMPFAYKPAQITQSKYCVPIIGKKRRIEEELGAVGLNPYPYNPILSPPLSESSYKYEAEESFYNNSQGQVFHVMKTSEDPYLNVNYPGKLRGGGVSPSNVDFSKFPESLDTGANEAEDRIELPSYFDSDSAGHIPENNELFDGKIQEWRHYESATLIPDFDAILNAANNCWNESKSVFNNYVWPKIKQTLSDSLKKHISDGNEDDAEQKEYLLAKNLFQLILKDYNPSLFNEILKNLNHKKLRHFRNIFNKTPLHMAIENKKFDYLEPLVSAGVEINALDVDCNSSLHLAILHNANPSVISFLLERGADTSLFNSDGETPIHLACRLGRKSHLEYLLPKMSSVNEYLSTKTGDTPLHVAVLYGHSDLVSPLLKKVPVLFLNNGGYTALDLAVIKEDDRIVKLLLSHMDPKDRKNIVLVNIILTKVKCDMMYELLMDYMRQAGEEPDFQIKSENNLSTDLSEKCVIERINS